MKDVPVKSSFIVLEGLDGSGTTTQAELLREHFAREGVVCERTCEPSDSPTGNLIRRVLRREVPVHPATLALLFAADRNEHLYEPTKGVMALLDSGVAVVCDRYLFSSLAYQSIDCGFDYVLGLNADFPLPGRLIFLDVPPEECMRRMQSRNGVELFERLELQGQILEYYRRGIELFSRSEMKVAWIDGLGPKESVHEKIWSFLTPRPIEKV